MKFVSYEKRSKKEKKKANDAKRKTWEHSPITRTVQSKKKYNRNDFKRGGNDISFSFLLYNNIRGNKYFLKEKRQNIYECSTKANY